LTNNNSSAGSSDQSFYRHFLFSRKDEKNNGIGFKLQDSLWLMLVRPPKSQKKQKMN